MTNDKRDFELFAEIQKENRISFNRLFVQYYQPLCKYAFAITKSEQESEELVSDMFFTIWTKAKKIRIDSSVKVYLYACVKHAALASVKSTRSMTVEVDQRVLMNIPLPSADAQSRLELVDLEQQFNKVIEQLPEKCREVYILNRMDNLRYKEIAMILNIAEKTVENHLVKAVSLIRQAMKSHQHPIL